MQYIMCYVMFNVKKNYILYSENNILLSSKIFFNKNSHHLDNFDVIRNECLISD